MVAMETMQFHITKMDLLLRNIFFLLLYSLIEPFDINKEMLIGINVGLFTYLGTSLSNGFALIFQVFIYIHEYANEIIFI